jgi:hypothetical protein
MLNQLQFERRSLLKDGGTAAIHAHPGQDASRELVAAHDDLDTIPGGISLPWHVHFEVDGAHDAVVRNVK